MFLSNNEALTETNISMMIQCPSQERALYARILIFLESIEILIRMNLKKLILDHVLAYHDLFCEFEASLISKR